MTPEIVHWSSILFLLQVVCSSKDCRRDSGVGASLHGGPYFDPATPTNVSAQLGTHAYLPCVIRQLGDKSQVSWVRNRDSHILTVDRYTFIADERFQCFHPEDSDTWTLQIKYVQIRDGGLYECQISTEPKICHILSLNVIVPRVAILGNDRDLHVNLGSTVTIKCVISRSIEEPAYIFWYHNVERVMSPSSRRHWVTIERTAPDTTVSTLVISDVMKTDSGNYTCSPSYLNSARVILHVLNGEHRAAMQDGVSGGLPGGRPGELWLMCIGFSLVRTLLYVNTNSQLPVRWSDVT